MITYETAEWSKNVITDFTSTTAAACPDDYNSVVGNFFGTHDYCPSTKSVEDYPLKKCTKSSKKMTNQGVDMTQISYITGQKLCVKRDQAISYHELAENRNTEGCAGIVCGSSTDSNKEFCYSGTKCPLNALTT